MALDTGDDDPGSDGTAGALSEALAPRYTSPRAQDLAGQFLDKNVLNDPYAEQQQSAEARLAQSAEGARKILSDARERMANQHYNQQLKKLAISQALLKPTQTGQNWEVMGNLAAALPQQIQQEQDFNNNRAKQLTDADLAINSIDAQGAEGQLARIAARYKANSPMAVEAMKVLGREIRPQGAGSGATSPYGKIAADEGLQPGSPQFNQRVTQLREQDLAVRRATAGLDANTITPAEHAKLSAQTGIPTPTVDPYQGLSTKAKVAKQEMEQRNVNSVLDKLPNVNDTLTGQINDANRFLELNRTTQSGPIRGHLPALSDPEQEMDAITSRLTPLMRATGSGSTSDYDAKMFKNALFSREKNYDSNANVVKGFLAQRQLELDHNTFLQDYASLNSTLQGAESHWRDYVNNNPIFDPSKPGQYALNGKRASYKDYFRSKLSQPKAGFSGGGKVDIIAKLSNVLRGTMAPGDVDALVGGTRMITGVPSASREQLSKLYAQLGEAKAAGDPSHDALQDQLLDHLTEVYLSPDIQARADGGMIKGMTDQALQGLTSGFSDELLPDEAKRDKRESMREFESGHPYLSKLATGVGSLPLSLALPLGSGSFLRNIATGAATGAAAGLGGSEGNVDDVGRSGIESGLIGGGLGAFGALASKYGVTGAAGLLDRLKGTQTPTSAEKRTVRAMGRDTMTPDDILHNYQLAQLQGVPTTVMDSGGPNIRALAAAAAQKGTPASEDMADALTARQEGNRGRVLDRVKSDISSKDYTQSLQDLTDQLYTNAKPLYEKAYETAPPIPVATVSPILDNKFGKKALKDAAALMGADGVQGSKPNIAAGDAGQMSLQSLDYTKRALDDMINTEEGTGPTNKGRILRKMRDSLLTTLDASSPDYKAARDQFAGDLDVRNALKTGYEKFGQMAPGEVKDAVKGMTSGEKDAFRTGVAQHLTETINSPSTDINTARRIIGSPQTVEKLGHIFDSPSQFELFKTGLAREAQQYEQTKPVLKAIQQGRQQNAVGAGSILESVDPSLSHTPHVGALSWGTRILNIMRQQWPMTEKTADQVTQLLSKGTPQEANAVLDRLSQVSEHLARRKALGSKAAMVGAALAGALSRPSPNVQDGAATPNGAPPININQQGAP